MKTDAAERACSIADCPKPYRARGFCITHYEQARANGMPLVRPRRADDLCCRCRQNPTAKRGSYCLGCKSDMERERRKIHGAKIREQQRLRYSPERRRRDSLAKYHLTPEGYDAMLASQNGRCAVCFELPPDGKFLHVDHDHSCCPRKLSSCGTCVRGLLCLQCNNGLGRFSDDADRLRRAANYLEKKHDREEAA